MKIISSKEKNISNKHAKRKHEGGASQSCE